MFANVNYKSHASHRAAIACFTVLAVVAAQYLKADERVDPNTLTGKLIMGFQGWFACPGDGTQVGWNHWGNWSNEATPMVEMLPDVSELPAAERCATSVHTANGPVELFDDLNPATVSRQFAWMQQYGLDGVALQRFATDLRQPAALKAYDILLANVRKAAEQHGRVFFVMYDLSSHLSPLPTDHLPAVARDWARLEQEGLTRSPAYLRHRGHPLIGIWGLGFNRSLKPGEVVTLLDTLARVSAPYGGVTVLGGVPSYWRTRQRDASRDPDWDQVWRRLGVISPWAVGRYRDDAGADTYRQNVLEGDLAATRALGVDYMPVIFPGFSAANRARVKGTADAEFPNKIPRRCGRFYWRQVYNALSVGASMLYGAMFDEVNEGTALFKVQASAAQTPVQGLPPSKVKWPDISFRLATCADASASFGFSKPSSVAIKPGEAVCPKAEPAARIPEKTSPSVPFLDIRSPIRHAPGALRTFLLRSCAKSLGRILRLPSPTICLRLEAAPCRSLSRSMSRDAGSGRPSRAP